MSKLLRAALIAIGLVFLITGLLGIFGMIFVTSALATVASMPMPGSMAPGLGDLWAMLGPILAFGWVMVVLQFIAGVLSIAAGAALKLPAKAS